MTQNRIPDVVKFSRMQPISKVAEKPVEIMVYWQKIKDGESK